MAFYLGALEPKADVRDYKITAAAQEFPESYSVEYMPPVKDQGSIRSCVAHATSTILEYFNKLEQGEYSELSTNFIYGMQDIVFNRKESGMYLRDACRIIKEYGDPMEATVPGNTEQPNCGESLREIIDDIIYSEASNQRVQSYARCNNLTAIKYAIMNYGPVLGSIRWYHENYLDKNSVIHFDETSTYGGHAIVIYGWNEKGWLCRNSWGENYGNKGSFVFPYEYKFKEAWSFVDADSENVKRPPRGSVIDLIYKFINFILNFIKGR